MQREFQEECQLEIRVGPFRGCLECHWQEDGNKYQELDLIFEVYTQAESIPKSIQSLEPHISFSFLPLQAILEGDYQVLPAAVVQFLQPQSTSLPRYLFENQLID